MPNKTVPKKINCPKSSKMADKTDLAMKRSTNSRKKYSKHYRPNKKKNSAIFTKLLSSW